MENNDSTMIPLVALESCEMRHDKRERRKDIIIIVLIIALLASIGIAAYERLQYDYASTSSVVEQNAEDGGNANYIGNDGGAYNGLSESNKND